MASSSSMMFSTLPAGVMAMLIISFPSSTSKFMTHVELDLLPEFTTAIKNISAPIERDVTFTCNVKNIGQFKVGWVKADTKAIQAIGDQIITHNQRVSVTGDFVTTFNLHIKEVAMDDGGNYMCQINTDPMTYQSAWLNVMVPPDIDMAHTSGDIVAREHEDTARLVCTAKGVPRPRIVWRREGGLKIRIKNSQHQHRLVDTWNSDTLEIHRVRREDMGAYLCIANNDVPPAVSRRIYLHVQFPPSILPGLSVLGSAAGNPLTLECIVESYPKSFVVWSIGDKILHGGEDDYTVTELPLSMYRISSKLTLKNFSQAQAGIYRCRGTNSLGQAESTTRVYPTEPEELIPRHEPKYEIIVESEEKVTLVKEVENPVEKDDSWKSPDAREKDSENEKQQKHGRRKVHENKSKNRRIGLLSSGTTYPRWDLSHWAFFLCNILLVLRI